MIICLLMNWNLNIIISLTIQLLIAYRTKYYLVNRSTKETNKSKKNDYIRWNKWNVENLKDLWNRNCITYYEFYKK